MSHLQVRGLMLDLDPPLPPAGLNAEVASDWVRLNLATDEAWLQGLGEGWASPVVRTYINPPSVILGLSRKIGLDVLREVCERRGISVHRRVSGGGTVYHDRSVLNVAWILPWDYLPGCGPRTPQDGTTSFFLNILIRSLASFGLSARQTRISDISIGDPPRKIAGSGQVRKVHGVLHHSSILLDLDLESMTACLPIPPDRPGIEHRDFVTSLRAASPAPRPDVAELRHRLQEEIGVATRRALLPSVQEIGQESTDGVEITARIAERASALAAGKHREEAWISRF